MSRCARAKRVRELRYVEAAKVAPKWQAPVSHDAARTLLLWAAGVAASLAHKVCHADPLEKGAAYATCPFQGYTHVTRARARTVTTYSEEGGA